MESEGASGTQMRKMLDGKCVKTIVFTRPMRLANHAAAKCDPAFNTRITKNSKPSFASVAPNRRKNQYATNASVRKPPPNASMEKSAAILPTTPLEAGVTAVKRDVAT